MVGMAVAEHRPPRVFISYSHDSVEHAGRVLRLANELRRNGINTVIDQYLTSPPEGWPAWMDAHIRNDDFVSQHRFADAAHPLHAHLRGLAGDATEPPLVASSFSASAATSFERATKCGGSSGTPQSSASGRASVTWGSAGRSPMGGISAAGRLNSRRNKPSKPSVVMVCTETFRHARRLRQQPQ